MEWLSGGGSCGNGRGKRMGRTPCGQTLFCQPPHFCRGGYLIRPAEELYKSAFSLAKRDSFSVWLRPARRGIVFPLAQLGPQPSRWRPCRLTDGTYPPAGKTTFSFAGERGVFTLQLVFAYPAGGQNHFFFCTAKEKAVLDSEKEKVDRWRLWGGAIQPHKAPTLLGYPSGKRL